MNDVSTPTNGALDTEYRRRLAAVQAGMREDGLDLLVSADSGDWLPPTGDARYLTGFTFNNLAPAFKGLAIVVPPAGDPVLVMPGGPQGEFADWARHIARNAQVRAATDVEEAIAQVVRELSPAAARVGLGQRFASFDRLPALLSGHDVVDAHTADTTGSGRGPFERARAIKSDYEIGLLSAAQTAADHGMVAFAEALSPGTRNAVAQSTARLAAVRAGAEDALVIMNAGTNPWVWWHFQADRVVPANGIASVEVNARVGGYTAQLARSGTIGADDDSGLRLLDAGVASVEAMVSTLRPGATGHDVWRAGTAALHRAGVESWGRLGHGMGLAMDEGIAVVEGNEVPLEVGSVIAVHAAPWDPGSRRSALIGEQYVIRAAGPEPLSATVPPRTWSTPGTQSEGQT